MVGGLAVIRHVPVNEAKLVVRLAHFELVTKSRFNVHTALHKIQGPRKISQPAITVPHETQGNSFSAPILGFAEDRQGAFELRERGLGSLLRISLACMRDQFVWAGRCRGWLLRRRHERREQKEQ